MIFSFLSINNLRYSISTRVLNTKYIFLMGLLCYSSLSLAKVEIVSYRGWKNCYQISNSVSKVIILPQSGGRVMEFTLNGKNIIYQNPVQDGKTYVDWQKNFFDPDGGRFDYGPEKVTNKLHNLTWMGFWTVKSISKYSITICSENDSLLGLSSQRTFTLDKHLAKLTTKLTAINISDKVLTRHYWSRTLVNPGGDIFINLNPKSRFKQGWGRFIFDTNTIGQDDHDPRISVKDKLLHFKSGGETFKFGADVKKGEIDYYNNGLKFQKKYKVGNLSNYSGSDNMSSIFYHCNKFLEIEPTSETIELQPGKKMSFKEVWELSKL
jgi:hypothetical protein